MSFMDPTSLVAPPNPHLDLDSRLAAYTEPTNLILGDTKKMDYGLIQRRPAENSSTYSMLFFVMSLRESDATVGTLSTEDGLSISAAQRLIVSTPPKRLRAPTPSQLADRRAKSDSWITEASYLSHDHLALSRFITLPGETRVNPRGQGWSTADRSVLGSSLADRSDRR